jgi:site-specific recombinase XerD
MQTICATGIRVSELQFITVETVQRGQAEVQTKGKVRIAFIPESLQKVLSHYASEQKIETGSVFRSVNGHPLDRSNIWREMKSICEEAGVPSHKVFPHNLRHLFARVFYEEFPALQPMLSGTI